MGRRRPNRDAGARFGWSSRVECPIVTRMPGLGRTALVVACAIAAQWPADALADGPTSITIKAPPSVKAGATFAVRATLQAEGPDDVFLTGGFLDFQRGNPGTTNRRCPATPVGTFAADTPQTPRPPGLSISTDRARNTVRRTGTLRYCLWVINARTYEQEAAGAAYIKAYAKRKKHAHAKLAAKTLTFSGRTAKDRQPIRFKTADHQIRVLTFTAQFHCSDGQTVLWATHLPPFPFGTDGSFNATPPPLSTINDAVTIRGRIKGRGAAGSFSEQYTSVLGNTCKTGTVKFSATTPKR
jgi:hypothetical protein